MLALVFLPCFVWQLPSFRRRVDTSCPLVCLHLNTDTVGIGVQTVVLLALCVPRQGAAFRLLRLWGGAPFPRLSDVARCTTQPASQLKVFNPFLSEASCKRLVESAQVWMQLCVLSDRLRRIIGLGMSGEESKPLLIQVMSSLSSTSNQSLAVPRH